MRKFIALLSLVAATFSAQANDYDFPTMSEPDSYKGRYAPVEAPVAIAPNEKIIYQAGLYDQMVMIGDDVLEPIATSAFLSAVDNSKEKPLWTVGIAGAAHISLVSATDDAVYVAGTFADDITIGSKDFNTKSFTGTDAAKGNVNAFIAKFTSEGNLVAAETIIPAKNSKYADKDTYYSDMAVEPTAIQLFNGKLYISFKFLGAYTTGDVKVDGNLKSSYGYYDNRCCAIVSYDANDLSGAKQVLDLRNVDEVNENGMCPQSICITADDEKLYVASFLSGDNILSLSETSQTAKVSFDHNEEAQVYGAIIITIGKDGAYKVVEKPAAASERAYVMNDIASMSINSGKLYLAGNVSTPLPFKDSLVPDLWTDQFAACLSTEDYSCSWAYITGAKREDITTTNGKYRMSIDGKLIDGKYTVAGATCFSCDASGMTPAYEGSTCLGLAATANVTAVATETASGCNLSITAKENVGIDDLVSDPKADKGNVYDLSGRSISSSAKGQIVIKSSKKVIAQ